MADHFETVYSGTNVIIGATPSEQKRVTLASGSALYYSATSDTDANDTQISAGTPVVFTATQWLNSAGTTRVLIQDVEAPTQQDLTITDDLVVGDDVTVTDDLDADAITGTSLSVDGAAGVVASADGGKNTLHLSSDAANVGITIGSTNPVELFRTGADALTITDATTVTGGVTSTGTLVASNAATVGTTLGVTGIITATGGIGAAATKARALGIRSADWEAVSTLSATGTDAAAADGTTVYLVSVFVPVNCTVTGIATLHGTNITTDKVVNYLFNAAGTKVGQTAAAGTAPTPADTFQEIDLETPTAITGPAVYFIGRQHNGTTITFQSIPADKGHEPLAGSVAGTGFGTETTVVPPTTFTADKGPFAYLY